LLLLGERTQHELPTRQQPLRRCLGHPRRLIQATLRPPELRPVAACLLLFQHGAPRLLEPRAAPLWPVPAQRHCGSACTTRPAQAPRRATRKTSDRPGQGLRGGIRPALPGSSSAAASAASATSANPQTPWAPQRWTTPAAGRGSATPTVQAAKASPAPFATVSTVLSAGAESTTGASPAPYAVKLAFSSMMSPGSPSEEALPEVAKAEAPVEASPEPRKCRHFLYHNYPTVGIYA